MLNQVYHHDIQEHGNIFWAVIVITLLDIENNGEPLFEVDTNTMITEQELKL